MSRNLLRIPVRVSSIRFLLTSAKETRSFAASAQPHQFINVQKENEKEVLAHVYQKEFEKALKKLESFEQSNSSIPKINSYFRIKLVSHLYSNGYEERCLELLDNLGEENITDDQFFVALERILNSDCSKDPIKNGFQFYKKVVENGIHRKRNRDFIIRLIIQKAASSKKMPFNSIWELFLELSIIEPSNLSAKEEKNRQKLHASSLWEIIKFVNLNIWDSNEKRIALETLKSYISANGSPIQIGCLNNAWYLFENRVIEFADSLLVSKGAFNQDYIEYLLMLATNTKEPRLIDCFLNYPNFFEHKPELFAKVCETLALIFGKNNDVNGLEALYKRILEVYHADSYIFHITYFKKTVFRISHFYKCSNLACPEDLAEILKRFY